MDQWCIKRIFMIIYLFILNIECLSINCRLIHSIWAIPWTPASLAALSKSAFPDSIFDTVTSAEATTCGGECWLSKHRGTLKQNLAKLVGSVQGVHIHSLNTSTKAAGVLTDRTKYLIQAAAGGGSTPRWRHTDTLLRLSTAQVFFVH